MDEQDKILTIVFSVLAFILLVIVISICIWCCYRRRRRQHSIIHFRQEYHQRKPRQPTNQFIQNRHKRRKKRFNTNESAISFSFNPPHLINQNVKNLDQLLANESLERFPRNNFDRCYTNPITEPVYTSSSSLSTPLPNMALAIPVYSHPSSQQMHNLRFHYLNDLNHAICSNYAQRSGQPLKYSQSCRERTDVQPFDFRRSMTPSLDSSTHSFFDSIYRRSAYNLNSTLIHKAHIGQLRDDTAIFY